MQNWINRRFVCAEQQHHPPCFWNWPGMRRNHFRTTVEGNCYKCEKENFSCCHLLSCSAKYVSCFECGKLGHFAKLCFTKVVRDNPFLRNTTKERQKDPSPTPKEIEIRREFSNTNYKDR